MIHFLSGSSYLERYLISSSLTNNFLMVNILTQENKNSDADSPHDNVYSLFRLDAPTVDRIKRLQVNSEVSISDHG